DLPHPPQERSAMRRSRVGGTAFESSPQRIRSVVDANMSAHSKIRRLNATAIDSILCGSINLLHRRHQLNGRSREEMERYVMTCERLSPHQYYSSPSVIAHNGGSDSEPTVDGIRDSRMTALSWRSPIQTAFAANNVACAELFRTDAPKWERAPTVFLLHSLMSTNPTGYHRWAQSFNELGWNACFVHLPYHFSRVPRGYWNGELAITCDLIRNAEGLRQGVMELRQLMCALRERGCREFGVLATSYGGWIGALLTLVESDFRFVALMSPIVNVEHAIWQSPAARRIRRELRQASIEPPLIARHFHLSSPVHTQPLCDPACVVFVTGEFDSIAPAGEIETIQQKWRGSELLRVQQGHFGHRMMPET